MPVLSTIILLERDDHPLAAALDAFLGQSTSPSTLEILFVAPQGRMRPRALPRHARLKVRWVAWPRGGGWADAIAAGAGAARADVVAILSDRWRVAPGFADYCLDFHARQPGAADVLALSHAADPAMAAHPLAWWLGEQKLYGFDVLSPGIHTWRALRFDALSAKRGLLSERPIPRGSNDERLMGTSWAQHVPVRVFAEPVPVLLPSSAPTLARVMVTEYRAAYARRLAIAEAPQQFAGEAVDARFEHPDRYLLKAADRAELMRTIGDLEHELAGAHPRFAVGAEAEKFEMLGMLYLAALSHARSAGWADAAAGKPRPAGEDRCRRFAAPTG